MSNNAERMKALNTEVSQLEEDIRIQKLDNEVKKLERVIHLKKEIAEHEAFLSNTKREICDQKDLDRCTIQLTTNVRTEFNRINTIAKAGIDMDIEMIDHVLWIKFRRGDTEKCLQIPLPTVGKNGIKFLKNNDVVRVLCDFWLEQEQKKMNFHQIVESLLCEDVNIIMPLQRSGSPMIHKIVKSFDRDRVVYMVSETQRLINDVMNIMPLHETDMNSWAMNHRIIIIDPVFDHIADPNEKLEYQVDKNRKYYAKFGWTAIGLSDGVLANKNYLLTTDLRDMTPFGQYHNPQRNLYSTLGMKGDELPNIRSESMQKLIKRGIGRKGWNMVTTIVDTALNFEDQILVDNRHRGLSHTVTKRFAIYGDHILAKAGREVRTGDVLGFSKDGQPVMMSMRCDEAKITKINRTVTDLNGEQIKLIVVTAKGKRFLRDGSKFSNLHGNKGIIKFVDLGHAVDPRNSECIPIDVMVSAKSVNKRKNFGQILEAIANNLNGGNVPIVVKDDFVVEKFKLKASLKAKGFPEDGTSMIDTYFGEAQAIVGKMFWGVTKDPEDQLWEEDRTGLTNNRELRTSGLKFSHVEMKALTTRFGQGNPLLKEILSYSQGVSMLQDGINILRSAKGEIDAGIPVIDAKDVSYVDITSGIFHDLVDIKGTIVDDEYMPEGFTLRIPSYFQAIVDKEDADLYTMGLPQEILDPDYKIEYIYNTIFIPNALSRRCWRHPSGKWGLNTVGLYVNHIVMASHKFIETEDVNDQNELMRAVTRYFQNVSKMMGGKNGELSTYGMAVRYPHSSKAVAALADNEDDYPDELKHCVVDNLPKNTIEIHREMAKDLKVKTGDVVLAERFPCLGFMSIRPQYIRVTDDPQCKYVIRASSNSLTSENLDFDGDNLFLASFHNPASIELLREEMKNPNDICNRIIESMNAKKVPEYREMTLDDFQICNFPKPTNDEHAELVRKATGVKSHTGPVIALAYNLMRIVERSVPYTEVESHVHLEVLLDFLGNTVFRQKHGIKSLQEEATDAICVADVEKMVNLGFDREASQLLCDLILLEAASLRILDLKSFHQTAKEGKGSKIINFIVRRKNKIYFASRALLGPFNLLNHLRSAPLDLPSFMLFKILRSKREGVEDVLDRIKAKKIKVRNVLTTENMRAAYEELAAYIDKILIK